MTGERVLDAARLESAADRLRADSDAPTSTPDGRISVPVTVAVRGRLDELAADTGMSTAKLAGALLEELLPTVQRVRTRLQVDLEARP